MTQAVAVAPTTTQLRNARPDDGARLWELVQASEPLDDNSAYAYLMWTREFADTTVVAEQEGRVVGFVTAFRPPKRPRSLFLWQITVARDARGQGLASRLLDGLVQLAGRPVESIEATVASGNGPSRALFQSFARRHDATLREEPYIAADAFPQPGHPAEPCIIIGPVDEVAP